MRVRRAVSVLGAAGLLLTACADDPTMGETEVPAVSAVDADVLAEDMVDEPPIRLSGPPPVYPPLLRDAEIEGLVVVEVVVGLDGRPEPRSFKIIESSDRAFEQSARDAVLGSSYQPGRMRGQVVRVLVRQPIQYTIQR